MKYYAKKINLKDEKITIVGIVDTIEEGDILINKLMDEEEEKLGRSYSIFSLETQLGTTQSFYEIKKDFALQLLSEGEITEEMYKEAELRDFKIFDNND